MRRPSTTAASLGWLVDLLVAGLLTAALLAVCLVAPQEATMGDAQRILYVHVAVAWFALLGLVAMAGAGLAHLLRRDLAWDHWAQAAAEVGWLSSTLTLVTGSLWAHAAWGTWWTWDPRLTASLVLWAIYAGWLTFRAAIDDRHRRARIGAVLALVGAADVPLVILATRWFRGMHPVAPEMAPAMRVVLMLSIVGFTALLALLVARRRMQLRLEHLAATCQRRVNSQVFPAADIRPMA